MGPFARMGVTLVESKDRQEHCLHRSNTFSTRIHEISERKEKESTKREHQGNEKGHRSWKGQGEPQLRIVSYNPLIQSSEGRLDDICHHFKERADVIILRGRTGKDWTNEGRPLTIKNIGFRGVQWSWNRRSVGRDNSCGVLIMFCGKRFPNSATCQVYSPGQRLWDELEGCCWPRRTPTSWYGLYLPPKTQEGAKAETRYRRTTQDLVDWSGVISEAFHRILPNVCLDPNDGLGLCQGQRERSMALGEGCKAKDGRADRLFRLMLAEQKSSRNTHTRNRYTEPGSAPNTRPRRRTGQRRLRAKSG